MAGRSLIAIVAVAAVTAVAAGGIGVARSSPEVVEFRLPGQQDIPAAIALGPDGAVWFTLESADAVGVLQGGVIHEIPRGGESLEALGLAVDDSGNVWLTDISGQSIKRLSSDGSRDTIRIPGPLAQLGRLALAPDGTVWFADSWNNSVTRLSDGVLTSYSAAESNAAPFGVAVDARGTVWATLQIAGKLARIDPAGNISELNLPTRNATPTDIAVDPSGGVWFTELRANKIGHLADGRFEEFSVAGDAPGLTSLAAAPDGSVWFTELRRHSLVRLQHGDMTEFPLSRDDARPFSVAISTSGDVWYTDLSGRVGKLPAERARSVAPDFRRIFAWLRG